MHRTPPQWREPPMRYGRLETAEAEPTWLAALWNWAQWGCAVLAIATLAIALGTWLASRG